MRSLAREAAAIRQQGEPPELPRHFLDLDQFDSAALRRILDLGTGDGRLLGLVRSHHPDTDAVAIDFSPAMLDAARQRFASDSRVSVIEHNLDSPLPELGKFDAVISSFAIHHLVDERKRALYAEVFDLMNTDGVFCNLEHVESATGKLHARFLRVLGITEADEDPSNKLAGVEVQLQWLREIGFEEVDCYWKWLELALLGGTKRT